MVTKLENNENLELCKKCGGKCCKRMPGAIYPHQFLNGVTWEKVHKLIITGKYSIDWWDKDDEFENDIYYLRPSIKGSEGRIYDPSWGGECIFLKEDGCELAFEDRPFACQSLIPKSIGCCENSIFTTRHAIESWLPYQHCLKGHSKIACQKL